MRAPHLLDELNLCHADGRFRKLPRRDRKKINVLLVYDFTITPTGRANATIHSNWSMIESALVLAS